METFFFQCVLSPPLRPKVSVDTEDHEELFKVRKYFLFTAVKIYKTSWQFVLRHLSNVGILQEEKNIFKKAILALEY